MTPTSPRSFLRHLVVTAVLVLPARAAAEEPTVGSVCEFSVVSVALSAGSTERETRRVVYAPPPGWYIRSHRVECVRKDGRSSFAVSTVPAGWQWLYAEQVTAAGRAKAAAAIPGPASWVGGHAEAEGERTAADRQANSSTHHVLVVDVTAKGAGLWRGGGSIELTVTAEMIYLGRADR